MTAVQLLQYLLSGVTIGSIYAVVAIGFNIIYNATGIINFAQGEFVMLGAMMAVTFSGLMPLPLAILLAVVLTALVGALLELVFIRWLKHPSVLRLVVITIGLSILLREAALHVWDEKVRALPYFTGNETSSINILGAFVSPQVLWVLGTTAAVVAGLTLFFGNTQTGRAMRACSANRVAATLCGISARRMVTVSFMLSAAIGALAGCVVSPISLTQYDCGTPLAIKGFTTAILGGLGNATGAVAAGLLIGVLETLSITVLPSAYKDVVSISILLIILVVRPTGLFGGRADGSRGA
ncbi:MAG: branched-chain amino acid ABC transporter permease [Candidatus Latescibacterota bacterium]|jgi:branched-chain amino acid transport system permease protein